MKPVLDIIASIPSFSGLSSEQLKAVRDIVIEKEFGRGELIFSDGDDAKGFYVVSEGQVKIYKMSFDGKEQILHIFGPGEPFGEVPVFSGKSFPANAQAISKSLVLFFPRKDFVELITENPSMALNMLAVLSMRLRQFTVQIENLSLKEVPGRLATYLVWLADEQGTKTSVTLTISKGQLASLLGTIPETLSRIFAKMAGDNLIDVSGRCINLIDREGLENLAEYGKQTDI
ncbi:Transcriptional regulator, Crp-type [Desulfonema limicola]|uniref:Transcriptional regulator, Crp-type n=1 Tax=Desulfonema limicola TaxID=45656 RepID=A0A975BBI3_9BACT|nr:Crp/Fnr family transcriptional regulator [Desulfonema limicola]QTA82307.1 Transcriptional regulator, Crp-type [Desulfonema limicola]